MCRANKVVLSAIVVLAIAGGTAAYNFFVGFPRIFEGRRVHRVTSWSVENHFQPELIYYAYPGPSGKEVRHGTFQRFESGHRVQQATYRHGRIDGPITYWNLFGEKTEEVYYRDGVPYGWAYFANGKLLKMQQEIFQQDHPVAVKTFNAGRYALQFNCGELISVSIDPVSGQTSSIPNPTERACAQP
jgi:hypothetical protein